MYQRPEWPDKVYEMPSELFTAQEREHMRDFLDTLHDLPSRMQPDVMYVLSSELINESLSGVSCLDIWKCPFVHCYLFQVTFLLCF